MLLWLLVWFPTHQTTSDMNPFSKGKKCSFLVRVDPTLEGSQNNFDIIFSCWKCIHHFKFAKSYHPDNTCTMPLRKHAYSTVLEILPPKNENFQIKNSDIFHISAQNIDCGYSLEPPRRGGSNEYPQSMFWAEIRKIMYTPVNPSFTI